MTAKEEAKRLVNKFNLECEWMGYEGAEKCVDEIINALLSESLKRGHMNSMLPFYEEVKREIGLV